MDLTLFADVLRRHKRLVLGGIVLAAVLAIFAYGRPTFSHGKLTIVPSGTEVWQTQSQLLITQQNDPYGNAVQGLTLNNPKPTSRNPPLQLGGVGYMESLAPIYAAIANGDVVQRQVRRFSRTDTVVATSLPDPISGGALPLVQLTVIANSKAIGQKLARLAATALENYVASQQAAGGVFAAQRVQLSPVQEGFQAKLLKGHKPTGALLVFVAVLAAAITLAFILENFRNNATAEAGAPLDPSRTEHETAPSQVATGVAPTIVTASAQPTPITPPKGRIRRVHGSQRHELLELLDASTSAPRASGSS
jgi:hypothetical protein